MNVICAAREQRVRLVGVSTFVSVNIMFFLLLVITNKIPWMF